MTTDPTHEREASIVKAAFEAAAQAAQREETCFDPERVPESHEPCQMCLAAAANRIIALPPESAILGAQIAKLEARLEEAKWWQRQFVILFDEAPELCERRIADLESQLSALKAKREGGAKK